MERRDKTYTGDARPERGGGRSNIQVGEEGEEDMEWILWINIKKKIRGSKVSGDPFVGSRN